MDESVIECRECKDAEFAIVLIDPFLVKVVDQLMKEGSIDALRDMDQVESSEVFYGKVFKSPVSQGLLFFSSSQYVGESIMLLKSYGIKDMIFVDTATGVKPTIKVGEVMCVYASATARIEEIMFPPVPDPRLFVKVLERVGKNEEAVAFTTRMPYSEIPSLLEHVRLKEYDLVDKNSAIIYNVCRGRASCVVIDVVDSNVAKGIGKTNVWTPESKYYDVVVDAVRELMNTLLSLEFKE